MDRVRERAAGAGVAAGSVALVLCLAACGPALRLGQPPIPATPSRGWDPSSLRLYADEQSRQLCSTPLPQPAFFARSAEMVPSDAMAVGALGRCLASAEFQPYRVELVGSPDRSAVDDAGAERLALERAERVEATLVDAGVAAQRISITTARDRADLDGRVTVGLFR